MKWDFRGLVRKLRPRHLPVHLRKIVIGIIGGIVLAFGIALIFLPGPAFLVIPAGLAILATEFDWARRWLHKARAWAHQKRLAIQKKRGK